MNRAASEKTISLNELRGAVESISGTGIETGSLVKSPVYQRRKGKPVGLTD
jgi:hypothetical protein